MELVSSSKSFGGAQNRYKHRSDRLHCDMHFSVYLPPDAQTKKVPVLFWLSGLTCTDENFVIKAGAQQYAAKYGLAIVCCDTSPRGDHVPRGAQEEWYFSLGAGFYLDATEEPWAKNYQMYSYVTQELPALVSELNIDLDRASIFGHSMGGHGALTIALKHPERFASVSALAPIVSPMNCTLGDMAFSNYLGSNRENWKDYDSCELVSVATQHLPTLVDQGQEDEFLEEQLKTDLLAAAAKKAGYPMEIRYQSGYDHSYFFVATFIEDHIRFHANHIGT